VGALTPSDVKRWDVNAIHAVFQTASGRAATLQRLGENLNQVHNVLADWQGEAGEAFRVDLGKARSDIEADGAESRQVAAAVSRAEADVRACKAELDDIERAADANGWSITPDWRIDVGDTGIGRNQLEFAAEQQALQDALNACKVHAHTADYELATAIRGAVGEVQLDAPGTPPGSAPPRQGPPNPADPRDKPPSLQDMLLPTGAGGDDPARMPRSLEDLLLPGDRAQPSDQQPLPASLPDLLSRLQQPVAPGAPPPQLKPAEVESFKAMLRPIMARDGVPPDQIEAQLDAAVANAQKWLDDGMPNDVPSEPPRQPPPGFGEGFGDRWFATEQGIKDLIGQGGPGAPGVLESWQQMLKGTTEIAHNPVGAAIGEVQNAVDSPSAAYYLGGKASDGVFALPTMLFGGEGAAVEAGLGDVGPGVLETGPVVSPHAPIGFDYPVGYNPLADQAAFDLNYVPMHGGPTAELSQQLADMSTHYIGDNPDRVVLGKFYGQEDGYIGVARGQGGIYFDTSNPIWDAFRDGLSPPQANDLSWLVNEQFLRTQMENGVDRIDYVVDPSRFSSVEDVVRIDPESFSAKEIRYLTENAPAYGYERVGNSWVLANGGVP
jgi:uncharacterized protein YukE